MSCYWPAGCYVVVLFSLHLLGTASLCVLAYMQLSLAFQKMYLDSPSVQRHPRRVFPFILFSFFLLLLISFYSIQTNTQLVVAGVILFPFKADASCSTEVCSAIFCVAEHTFVKHTHTERGI